MKNQLLDHKPQSKERQKALGEIFTPLPLVDEILSKLPEDRWDRGKTFLDNSCGSGNFLIRVIAWKIHKGSTVKQAIETTYGVDLMEDNVNHARERILINAFAAHTLKNNGEELLPHLTHDGELALTKVKGYPQFKQKYEHIVNKNVVCHDALTYDYSFSSTPDDIVDAVTKRLNTFGIEL